MKTLQEWAKYYQKLGIWVLPYPSQAGWDSFWKRKSDKDYYNISKRWTWNEDKGLHLVVGRKGVRVIELLKNSCEGDTTKHLLKALRLLRLPEDYSWIIERKDRLGIIIATLEDSVDISKSWNGYHGRDLLLVEGHYVLPPSNDSIKFYKDRLPNEFPNMVDSKVLFGYVERIDNNTGVSKDYVFSTDNVANSLRKDYIEVKQLDRKGTYFGCKIEQCGNDNPHYVIVKSNGEEIYFNNYKYFDSPIIYYDNSHLLTSKEDKYGFVSVNGYVSIPFKYDEIRYREDNRFDIRIGKRWGVLSLDGHEVVPVKYSCSLPKSFDANWIVQDADSDCFGLIDKEGHETIPCIYEHLFKSEDDNLFIFVYNGELDSEFEFHSIEALLEYSSGRCGLVDNKGIQIIEPHYSYLKLYSHFILAGRDGTTYNIFPSDAVYDLYTKEGEMLIGGFKDFYYDESHELFFFFFGGEWECGLEHSYDSYYGRDYYDDFERFDRGDDCWLILDKNLKTIIRDENGEQMQFKKGFIGKVKIEKGETDTKKKKYVYNFPSKYLVTLSHDIEHELFFNMRDIISKKYIVIKYGCQVLEISTGIMTKEYAHIELINDLYFLYKDDTGVGITNIASDILIDRCFMITRPVSNYIFVAKCISIDLCCILLYDINNISNPLATAIRGISKEKLISYAEKGYLKIKLDKSCLGLKSIVLPTNSIYDEDFVNKVSFNEKRETYSLLYRDTSYFIAGDFQTY